MLQLQLILDRENIILSLHTALSENTSCEDDEEQD